MANIPIATTKLHDAVTATGNGAEFDLQANYRVVNLEIVGTATASTIVFEAKSPSGNYYSIAGINLSTMQVGSQTKGKSEMWQFSLDGFVSLRAKITAISGGNITVYARAIQ